MDGVKVLASGFEKEEKLNIEKIVTAMSGELHGKTSLDINFVVAKNVLAAKYKWALNVLRKPIVTIDWLHQCWHEHRLVPHKSYEMPPFTGLIISATRIPPDERKEMEELVMKYGGQYSADLTKKCTHLISNTAEGDKYKVAKRWGHIKIVNQMWFSQSIATRACLDDDLYPVQATNTSKLAKKGIPKSHNQDKEIVSQEIVSLTMAANLQSSISQRLSSTPSVSLASTKEQAETVGLSAENTSEWAGRIAADSQNEDNDLYLANCRIILAGFQAVEMRKLVSMVRSGGGSRYMSFSEKLTHIIVGKPSKSEMKEIRKLAVWGVTNVVNRIWLEDCTQQRREVTVTQRHIIPEKVLLQGWDYEGAPKKVDSLLNFQEKNYMTPSGIVLVENRNHFTNQTLEASNGVSLGGTKATVVPKLQSDETSKQQICSQIKTDRMKVPHQSESDCILVQHPNHTVSEVANIFGGCKFVFSKTFPENRRDEIKRWVIQGGGFLVEDGGKQKADYIIECHGLRSEVMTYSSPATLVSSQWIRYCLEERVMLDVGSHVLYKPLPCQIPLPGFESMRFCVSQYEERDRILLRNLCYVLGAKFTGKLNKKVTHLLCKFSGGPKYEAARSWGIEAVTADWINECIKQDCVVPLQPFRPSEISAKDRDAGFFPMTQYPTQAAHMASGELPSQWQTDNQAPDKFESRTVEHRGDRHEPRSRSPMRVKRVKKAHEPNHLKRISATRDVACSSDPWDGQAVQWSGRLDNDCREPAESSKRSCKRIRKAQQQTTQESREDALMDNTIGDLTREEHNVKESVASCSRKDPEETITCNKTCQKDKIEDSEPPSDIATVIEDLLAQSRELQHESLTGTYYGRNLVTPDRPILVRTRPETPLSNFGFSNHSPSRLDACSFSLTCSKGGVTCFTGLSCL
eukprot:Gb_04893 [translate_table: standard]